jgi:hypothetical protein
MSDVDQLIAAAEPPVRRDEARALVELMTRVTGAAPERWGSMIGFGRYRYRYESGREGEAFRIGFAPRKAELVLYVMDGFPEHAALLAKLGKHRTGKSCLYVKRLSDLDLSALEALVASSWACMAERYPD